VACTVVLLAVASSVVYPLLLVVLESFHEEASRVAGASWWATYRRIVLRLMAPTNVIMPTATSANRPLSILQLDFIAQRKFEEAMVVACIIMVISLAGALVARVLGLRGGPS